MDPLVLDARDIQTLVLAYQYAPQLVRDVVVFSRDDFGFDHLNRGSAATHPSRTENGIEIEQRGANVPVITEFAHCLRHNITQTNPAQTLREITQCINITNSTLWRSDATSSIRGQICYAPSVVDRGPFVEEDPEHPNLSRSQNCSVTRNQEGPIQYPQETTIHLNPPVLTEGERAQVTQAFQSILQPESDRALLAEQEEGLPAAQQYRDWLHTPRGQDARSLCATNASLFEARVRPRLQAILSNEKLAFFIDRVIDFYKVRIREAVSYPRQNIAPGAQAVSDSPTDTMEAIFTVGRGQPRYQLQLLNNTFVAQAMGFAGSTPEARRWNFIGYNAGASFNSRGVFNFGAEAGIYFNRFDDSSWLLEGGPRLSFRLPVGGGHTHLALTPLVATYLSSPQSQGQVMFGGAVEVMEENNQSLCSPISPTAISLVLAPPHATRCLRVATYMPRYASWVHVLRASALWNPSSQEIIPMASFNLEGVLRAVGVRTPDWVGVIDLSLSLAAFLPPRSR